MRNVAKKFTSRIDVPENKLLSIVFFLTEEKEYRSSDIESKILYCFEHYGTFYYSLELSFRMQESSAIRTIKNML